MRHIKLLLLISLLLFPVVVGATTPTPTAVTGTITHGTTVTVTGSAGFGAKSPVAPLWWDNGEGASDTDAVPTSGEIAWVTSGSLAGAAKHYNDAQPNAVTESAGAANIRYRAAPYRTVAAPHTRSTKFMTGGHDDEGECLGGEVGQDVGVVVGDTARHDIWYVRYYLRLDPAWPVVDVAQSNYKFFDVNFEDNPAVSRPKMYDTSPTSYAVMQGCACGAATYSRVSPFCNEDYWSGLGGFNMLDATTCPSYASPNCWSPLLTLDTAAPNPIKYWTREEWQLNTTTEKVKFSVNESVRIDTARDADCSFSAAVTHGNDVGAFTIGGFWKKGMCGEGLQDDLDDDAWRYFDDIYVDNTWSRVMLCNQATYAASTICEPQIPTTSWSDTSLQVVLNLGALPTSGDVYLYVFNADNEYNSTGLKVTLGATEGGTSIVRGGNYGTDTRVVSIGTGGLISGLQ